jgi:hypothetical protein
LKTITLFHAIYEADNQSSLKNIHITFLENLFHCPNILSCSWYFKENLMRFVISCGVSFCQVLKKVSKYIQEQNEKIYAPQGLLLTDPIERGLRVVSFSPDQIWWYSLALAREDLTSISYLCLRKFLCDLYT